MLFRKCDMLSPQITLFFKGEDQHSTIFSGILSIIAYACVFGFGIYYCLDFIKKENPTSFFFNRYVEDTGDFPVNASSMFHFIQTMRTDVNEPKETDFDAFRIFGIEEAPDIYIRDNDLSKYDHWLYGPCNNKSDTEGISYLIDFKYFEQSGCIRKYYDKDKKNYFLPNEENFRWPLVKKGASNPNRTFYGVIMEKCRNDEMRSLSGDGACKSDEEINLIMTSSSIVFYIIDNYADVLNYKTPIRKYLYAVPSGIYSGSISQNNLNFNPVTIITHNGIFMDNVINELSYFFSQNEKVTLADEVTNDAGEIIMVTDENGNSVPKETGMVACYYFWMQNRMQIYERNYKRLQDVLGDIGGLSSIVLLVAEILNYLVSYYTILIDTEKLALSLYENNYGKKIKSIVIKYEDNNSISYPPKKPSNNRLDIYDNLNNQPLSSNYQRFLKNDQNEIEIFNFNNYNDLNEKDKEDKNTSSFKNNKITKIKIKKKKKIIKKKVNNIINDNNKEIQNVNVNMKTSYKNTN